MRKTKKAMAVLLSATMVLSLAACGGKKEETSTNAAASATAVEDLLKDEVVEDEKEGYTYGAGKTFHSEEPVTYSMMFSDHENYPYKKDWRIWSAIKEKANVDFDLTLIARSDYEDKKSVLVNSGDSPYIIPKTYDESKYVNGGQVVAISDWVQYMPNYQDCIKKWNMVDDLKTKLQSDGKYYVLPGMWETANVGYSYIIRKDVFEAAGIDVKTLEKDWDYEKFYEALKTVKEYTGAKTVFSDRFEGKSALKQIGIAYGVSAGWSAESETGMKFDPEKKEFYFAETSDNMKAFLTYFSKLVKDGIYDPESFSQAEETALAKFYKGDSYVVSGVYQNLTDIETKMQVDGAELYLVTTPGGPIGNLQSENTRLENGVMISQNALDDLGEEGFIKMLRFVDWLWYSDEGQTLCQWGVEGETYTKDATGKIILNPEITYNGINQGAAKQLNVDYGFAGGVFSYGGTTALKTSKFTEGQKDFEVRITGDRGKRPIEPPIMANEEESEELNLIKTPLMDFVKTMTLKFITGQASVDTDWDAYVTECNNFNVAGYVDLANEIFARTKGILGY